MGTLMMKSPTRCVNACCAKLSIPVGVGFTMYWLGGVTVIEGVPLDNDDGLVKMDGNSLVLR